LKYRSRVAVGPAALTSCLGHQIGRDKLFPSTHENHTIIRGKAQRAGSGLGVLHVHLPSFIIVPCPSPNDCRSSQMHAQDAAPTIVTASCSSRTQSRTRREPRLPAQLPRRLSAGRATLRRHATRLLNPGADDRGSSLCPGAGRRTVLQPADLWHGVDGLAVHRKLQVWNHAVVSVRHQVRREGGTHAHLTDADPSSEIRESGPMGRHGTERAIL
jgi:hypothetical protein